MEPTSTAMSGMDIVSNVVPALMLVIGAPLALWWWTRRNRGATPHRLRITEKAALGRSLWVAVVEVDDKRFLVGAGEGSVGLIAELADTPAAEALAELTATQPAAAGMDLAAAEMNGFTERPRMGLVERLQRMTLRTPPPPSTRSFHVSRR